MIGNVISSDGPLPHDNPARVTESGIALPTPDPEKGSPIVICQTDVPGLIFNMAAPLPEDVREIADAIAHAQARLHGGDDDVALWFREPQYGEDCVLLPDGITHILSVCRGFARFVDPFAAPTARGAPLLMPRGRG